MTSEELIQRAQSLCGEFILSHPNISAGTVGSAILTQADQVYTGINMDLFCGVGFCAEHSAVAEMLKHRETHIKMVVAMKGPQILPPCGRCRELMLQIDVRNRDALVILPGLVLKPLKELMPMHWMDFSRPKEALNGKAEK
ncbi:MAG: cytidine deaminase [Bacteroidota bacterium]